VENPHPPVYATAARKGWRTRLASALALSARRSRIGALLDVLDPGVRILDLGCGPIGLRAFASGFDITGLDRVDRPGYPGPFVRADATQALPFGDDAFDLVYCSSVIEHIAPPDREAFASELRRVGRGWFVQTPAWEFPIEPHALLPFAHWLPPRLRRPYWRLGVAGDWEQIELLRRAEMTKLFGTPEAERIGFLVKSWITVRT
jgi:SAM-dependent methyltransferase